MGRAFFPPDKEIFRSNPDGLQGKPARYDKRGPAKPKIPWEEEEGTQQSPAFGKAGSGAGGGSSGRGCTNSVQRL